MEWTAADLAVLEQLKRSNALLPDDAPRALLSVRLSVLTEDTTSPVRQELDLRVKAHEMGYRVVGVASDLNVSATKIPPWKRKQLGDWLNNRAPEFDVLLFWKLDRFVRRLSDLSAVIDWCLKYGKNLVSRNESIDLTTEAGKNMVMIIGGIAEIEATNTSTHVTSLWDYTKTQSQWLVGKPAYGYMTAADDHGRVKLVIDPDARRVLHWCRRAALRGVSATRMVKVLARAGISKRGNGTLTTSTMLRRLRNPALMGYRVEEDKSGTGPRRSKVVLGDDGEPVRVADAIFTQEEFDDLQTALDRRGRKQPARRPGGATKFLGVLVCADCGTNLTVHVTTNDFGQYRYLRCRACPSGGLGAPDPDVVYERLVQDVLSALGDYPVETREYARGVEAREEVQKLKGSVAYYTRELEPGGRFAKPCPARERAQATLDQLLSDLEGIDLETTRDRWIAIPNGMTFRERWEVGGTEDMAADLVRVGVKCEVTRTKLQKVRAPEVRLSLLLPEEVRKRLILKDDDFAARR